MNQNKSFYRICVVGSGTAGLISALFLRKSFPASEITIISSSDIGIVGVGEGSTEHWKDMMRIVQVPLNDMIASTSATHKYGIRFEGWSTKHPDYFHSVSGDEELYAFGLYPTYMGFLERGKLLTNQTTTVGLWQDKIRRLNLHENTNQFHFDTFKLNKYFTKLCFERSIKMVDGTVSDIGINSENGCIESVTTEDKIKIEADFFLDATGFKRAIISKLETPEWVSFSPYLLGDSAIAFPTELDPSGKIRSYTRARAASSGWVWEIPTQERRGNGYVYSSNHISEDDAVKEIESMIGYNAPSNYRKFSFDPGYLKKSWIKNCVAIGLSSSFVEPIEATSIGSTIQQIKLLIPSLSSYTPTSSKMQEHYNKTFEKIMDNILTMVRLHYMTDIKTSQFWIDAANMKVNDSLQEILDLWSERPPSRYDVPNNSGEMFLTAHLMHVAQGQGLINLDACGLSIDRFMLRTNINEDMSKRQKSRHDHELVDHAEALREISDYDI